MILIFTNPANGRQWKIEPFDNGLCYRVFKSPIGIMDEDGNVKKDGNGRLIGKNGKSIVEDWLFTEKYPRTLADALSTMVDLMLADPQDMTIIEADVKNVRKLGDAIKRHIDRCIMIIVHNEKNKSKLNPMPYPDIRKSSKSMPEWWCPFEYRDKNNERRCKRGGRLCRHMMAKTDKCMKIWNSDLFDFVKKGGEDG